MNRRGILWGKKNRRSVSGWGCSYGQIYVLLDLLRITQNHSVDISHGIIEDSICICGCYRIGGLSTFVRGASGGILLLVSLDEMVVLLSSGVDMGCCLIVVEME